jgi:hypothetical protein
MSILGAVVASACVTAQANVCVYKTVHVRSVQGYVSDSTSARVAGAKVIAKEDGNVIGEGTADSQGNFRLSLPRGEYDLIVNATGFAPGHARVKVGFGFRSLFHSNTLRMVVSPGMICKTEEAGGLFIAA